MSTVIERFLRYVKIDTQSDFNSESHPTTDKQLVLSRIMAEELKTLRLVEVEMDLYGNVTATMPANIKDPAPVMGLLAHLDTSTEMTGANVKPRLLENYDGGDILLNPDLNIILSPRDFPDLKKYVGKTLITTDGTTLLGADNKAGVAEIMAALEFITDHSEIPHGKLRIAFTTDEETGRGIGLFDLKKFKADYAYTIDGGELGELQYENFNASRVTINIQGREVHTGEAKDKMINASLVAMEFNALLPAGERPEYTSNYEGFFHLEKMSGMAETARLVYLVRDHDLKILKKRNGLMQQAVEWMNHKYGAYTVMMAVEEQYLNMREKIEPVMWVVELAREAMQAVDVTPLVTPIRGGTDGARLSWQGLPTPNLFTGGHNFHGKYEYIPTFAMEKAVETLVKLVELGSQRR
jgi:tripeptide aminopeptidase